MGNERDIELNEAAIRYKQAANPAALARAFEDIVHHGEKCIRYQSRKMPVANMTDEDIFQELCLHLPKILHSFDPAVGPFVPFLRICCNRRVLTLRNLARGRKKGLGRTTSLDYWWSMVTAPDSADRTYIEGSVCLARIDPRFKQLEDAEEASLELRRLLPKLSKMEKTILGLMTTHNSGHLDYVTTIQRAKQKGIKVTFKQIDNVCSRIRRKAQAKPVPPYDPERYRRNKARQMEKEAAEGKRRKVTKKK